MNKRYVAGLISAVLLASPAVALADFNGTAQRAQAQAASLTTEQLDNLNTRVVNDAYVTARIIGYDPSEIRQLRADVAALKQENAQLRAQVRSAPSASAAAPDIEARVSRLEASMESLNNTLMLVVKMLTTLLAKMS
ncbi:MAG: hypothetical protein AAB403_13070 [Planctomycetota bacterium]